MVAGTIDAKQPQQITLSATGGLRMTTVHVWETNGQHTFQHIADIAPVNGLSYALDPDSPYTFTTTTGQGRGTATPPPSASFPLPYADDFEDTAFGRAPLPLGPERRLREPALHEPKRKVSRYVITMRPIPWDPMPDPFTLAGDVQWSDYRIAVDFLIKGDGSVTLMGRIDSADVFKDGKALWPSGYVFSIPAEWEVDTLYSGIQSAD